MTILATRPPATGASFIHEDLGLSFVTAALRRDGVECRYHDGLQEGCSAGDYVTKLVEAEESILCVTVHAECWADEIFAMLGRVKARAPQKVIIAGGHPVSMIDEAVFAACPGSVDYLVRGDGERTIVDLVRAIGRGRDHAHVDEVAGISFIRDGSICRTPDPPSPPADLRVHPVRDTWRNGLSRPYSDSALISFARGCNYACSFCSVVHTNGVSRRFWRGRPVDDFMEELESVGRSCAVTDFTIVDPNFLGSPETGNRHVIELTSAFRDLPERIIYDIACRADDVEPRLLEPMVATGLSRVFLGLESGSQHALDGWSKSLDVERSVAAMRMLDEMGVYVQAGMIMLAPTTDLAEIRNNLEFLGRLPYFEHFSLCAPLWPLHAVTATRSIPPDLLVARQNRIRYGTRFAHGSTALYYTAMDRVRARLSPWFGSLRNSLWLGMKRERAIIRGYSRLVGELLAPCLDLAREVVDGIEAGFERTRLIGRVDSWLDEHENAYREAAVSFEAQPAVRAVRRKSPESGPLSASAGQWAAAGGKGEGS